MVLARGPPRRRVPCGFCSRRVARPDRRERAGSGVMGSPRWDEPMNNDRACDVRDVGEAGVIARALRRAGSSRMVLAGIGDDAAVLHVPRGAALLASCDMLVEGVHFRRDWSSPEQVGAKAAAVNLSDIAAMGGRPSALLTSLALPPALPVAWVEAFYAGFGKVAAQWQAPLAGGDTVGSPGPVVVDVTVLGYARRPVKRFGAQPGDNLVLTGPVGGAAAGLALLASGCRWPGGSEWERRLLAAQLTPSARVREGRWLAGGARAMTDLSDGLGVGLLGILGDRVGASIEGSAVPRSAGLEEAARRLGVPIRSWLVDGGEDYELLAAVPAERLPRMQATFARHGRDLFVIGTVEAEPGIRWREDGREVSVTVRSFEHFHLDS